MQNLDTTGPLFVIYIEPLLQNLSKCIRRYHALNAPEGRWDLRWDLKDTKKSHAAHAKIHERNQKPTG